jgi:hypothetical protein
MSNITIDNNNKNNEDDFRPNPGININPPPKEGYCDCCGRHISKLKPFGGPGDPVVVPDNKTNIVPNAKMTGDNITNSSDNGTQLVELVFHFECVYDVDHGCQIIEEILSQDNLVLEKPTPSWEASQLADGSFYYKVPVWTNADDDWEFHCDITEKVKERFEAEGII